jgi:hypothetical protein
MDSLISSLENFKLKGTGIDDICEKLDNLSTVDPNYEWDNLQTNYNRLKFIQSMQEELNESPIFDSLTNYMETIDKINQYYLKIIVWEDTEKDYLENAIEIKKLLEMSLNTDKVFLKIKIINDAYGGLVKMVEEMQNVKARTNVDKEFVLEFTKKRKRS